MSGALQQGLKAISSVRKQIIWVCCYLRRPCRRAGATQGQEDAASARTDGVSRQKCTPSIEGRQIPWLFPEHRSLLPAFRSCFTWHFPFS